MSHLNRVSLIGRVGKNPEFKSAKDGKEFASFTLATSEGYTDKNTNQKVENTEWHNITVFNSGLVSLLKQYIKKGALLFVEGSLQTRKYTGADNIDRWSTSIVIKPFGGEIKILDWGKNSSPRTPEDVAISARNYENKKIEATDENLPW